MGQQFNRIAIAETPGGTENIVLESQLMIDFGNGQGPMGGVVTVKDGWVAVNGAGSAQLSAGTEEQGGVFPSNLKLTDKQGALAVEIAAHARPDSASAATVYLEGAAGNLWMGGKGTDGDLLLYKKGQTDNRNAVKATIHLDAAQGNLWLGANGTDGDLLLFTQTQVDNRNTAKATVHLEGAVGKLRLRDPQGSERVLLDGSAGNLWLGGKGVDGGILLFKKDETDNRNAGKSMITFDANQGDITLRNADCAEDFDVAAAAAAAAEPGTVMVIDADGCLEPSRAAYDRKVAGVVSGAGSYKPAMILDRQDSNDQRGARCPVALMGKVYCKAEATSAPIAVGDLLTSSDLPGHAMKAQDPARAFGAVIGKALSPLADGQGLIPILVTLQ